MYGWSLKFSVLSQQIQDHCLRSKTLIPAESGYFDDEAESKQRQHHNSRRLGSTLGEDERMVGRLLAQFLEAMQYNTHAALEMVCAE